MPILGIDLGTTNSLVAVMEKGRPRILKPDGLSLLPSVVSVLESGDLEVGASAKNRRLDYPATTFLSVKRLIGRGVKDAEHFLSIAPYDASASNEQMIRLRAGNRLFTPIEISAAILRKLKDGAELELGTSVSQAVITVPAYFDDAQRHATKFAGELAGLNVVRILNEPTSACLAYGLDKKANGIVAVFDLGGGTFDISVLRVQEGLVEVLATHGDMTLGGDDFDEAIAKQLASHIQRTSGRDFWQNAESRSLLIHEAEELKRRLTDSLQTTVNLSKLGVSDRVVTREEMETWIEPVLARATAPCVQCMEDAKLKKEQITDVILVGGSTRTPAVGKFVHSLFGRLPICSLNPDEVVAMGAAIQANTLAGGTGNMLLLDVIPLSFGIETIGGIVSKIIHRNSTIPISAAQTFTTYIDGQVSVDIHVLQGEREMVKDNRSLARFKLSGIDPMPAGIPKIEVEFIVDANGILNVRATELRTGKAATIQVNPSYGLSDSEVEKMLSDAFENAQEDFDSRFLIEARTEADSLIRATRKSLEHGASLLQPGEAERIDSVLHELTASLNERDHQSIRKKMEDLNAATQNFAERLLNHAVSGALKDRDLRSTI